MGVAVGRGVVKGLGLALSAVALLMVACSGTPGTAKKTNGASTSAANRPLATFTPSLATPLASGGSPLPTAAHPVVTADCLRGLSSYKFAGTLAVAFPTSAAGSGTAAAGGALAGSLANLLSNISFSGAAQAPDRASATITFGSGGTQPLQVVQVGDRTYSRFGTSAWQQGNQIAGLGNLAQLDPQSLCESTLKALDTQGQTPAHETVNGTPSLRYHFSGDQLSGGLFGRDESGNRRATATPAPPTSADLTVWVAEKGGYPVRMQFSGGGEGASARLSLDVADVNDRGIQIAAPTVGAR